MGVCGAFSPWKSWGEKGGKGMPWCFRGLWEEKQPWTLGRKKSRKKNRQTITKRRGWGPASKGNPVFS